MLRNCSKDTLYGKADDKLTRITSKLAELAKSEQESYEDIRAMQAPSECWHQVLKQLERRKKLIFQLEEMDPAEYLAAVRERTSERWVYYNLPF